MKSLTAFAWCMGFVLSAGFDAGYAQQQTIAAKQPDYVSKDIPFKAHDDVPLYGRLVLPATNPPRAIVLYIQTAEAQTIDVKRPLGNGKTFNYYDVYRDKLPPMGIAFFSYEGRGVRMGDDPPR